MHSKEAERNVIGGIFLDSSTFPLISGLVDTDDFFEKKHKHIFGAISNLDKEDKLTDVVTVAEDLDKNSLIERAGGLAYIVGLRENAIGTSNIKAYAKIVRDRSRKRKLAKVCQTALSTLGKPDGKCANEIITETQTAIDELLNQAGGEYKNWVDVLVSADQSIQDAATSKKEGRSIGIPTGLPALDNRTGGLIKKRLTILAARPSLGKTALAQQISLYAAAQEYSIGICTLESSADELGIRSYANCLQVNGTALTFGDSREVEEYTNKLSGSHISKYKIWVDDSTYSLGGIVSRAHEWKHKHDIDLLVVDHIGLVEVDVDTANARLGKVTRALKKLSKRLDISVLALCQLNRSAEKENRRPRLSDLRDSGNIEQDCDVAIFLHSDDDSEGAIQMEIGTLKTRYGKKGWLPQVFHFDGRTQRFTENYPHAA